MKKKKVLIVEDEKIVALDLRSILINAGFAVAGEVSTGKQAITAAGELSPDIILMDISLKGTMSGIDAARTIIERHDIPIVFLTANSDQKTLEQAKHVSAYGYILKPFDERDIRTTVELVLFKHLAEVQVKQQRRWLETTLRSIGDAVIATDKHGLVTFMNVIAEQLTGWSQEEAAGKKLGDVFVIENEDTGKRLPNPVATVLRNRAPLSLTNHTILIAKNGKRTFIEDSAAPIFDDASLIIGVVLTFRDVTERRKAQDELNRNEQRFRALIEKSSEVVSIIDLQGNITYTTGTITTMLGYTMKEIIGKNTFDFLHPDEMEVNRKQFEELLRQPGKSVLTQIRFRHKDRSWRWVEAVGTNLLNDPAVNGLVVNFRDFTYKKDADEQLNHLNTRLGLIARVTNEVIGSLPIQKQTREMIDQVKNAFDVEAVIVRVAEDEHLHLLASIGVDEHRLTRSIATNHGLSKQIMTSRRALAVKDVRENFASESLRDRSGLDANRFDFISYAGAPLLIGHTVIGIIGLYSKGTVREFSATDLEHLQIVANHISVAIANARLFKEIREQNVEMMKHIEEQSRAEKLLRDSEERYRQLVEHSPTAIFVHVNGIIQFVNHATVILFGATVAAELIGRKVMDLIHPEFREHAEERMRKVYSNYMLPMTEQKYLRLDGVPIDVEISSIPFTFEGESAAQVIARNITERKQHEIALLESELRFRSLFENAKDAVFLTDTKTGTVIDVNAEAEKMLKRSRTEIIGKHQSFIHPPDRSEEAESLFREQILTLGEHPIEFEVFDSEGKRIPVEIKASVVRLDDNRIISQGIFRDISERKMAEESLRESEHRFRTLAENLPGVVYLCKHDSRFTMLYLNDQVEHLTGYAKDEFLDERISFVDLYHPDDVKQIMDGVNAALAQRLPFHLTYRVKHKNGNWRWIEEQGIGIYRDDSLLRLEGFLSDITDRKIAEAALTESEEKYRRLFEDSKDGIYITSFDGQLLDVNTSMMEILGFSDKEEMKQYNVRDFYFYPYDRLKLLRELEQNDYVKDFSVTLKRKDSNKAHVLITAVVIRDDRGRPVLFNGSMRDITEKKQLEQQLIQAQKMESIGTLAGGIAHDFNNLLAMILGTAELIKRHAREIPAVQNYITRIIEASERGSSISKQLLLFARPEQSELQPISVLSVVDQVNDFLSHFLPKNVTVRCERTEHSPMIMGDEGHLHQAVLNLSINARDAMPNGGLITIGVSLVDSAFIRTQFVEAADHEYVAIAVHDTGTGMEEEIQQRIFEPFFSTKSRGKGTGLGLAIVHGIVKLHQGFINVRSKKGIGTTFTMYFPSITVVTAEAPHREEPMTGENKETILVVDDEEILREILGESLREEGYSVLTASDGIEALKVYAENRAAISLVITDLGMPNMGGEELFGKLYDMDPKVKVIVSSGYLDNSTRSDLLRHGIKDVLTKPYRFDLIFTTIRRILDIE
jgi:two-component system cell cycle sensor histidine kinase/response regulator CckA